MIAWCLLILAPFINIILWSIVQALALFPIHKRLSGKLGGRPRGGLVYTLIDEVKAFKVNYDAGNLVIPPLVENMKEWPLVGDKLYNTWHSASVNIDHFILIYKEQLVETGSKIAKGVLNTAGGVLQVLISLIITGVIGGFVLFGFIGLFTGAIIMSVGYTLFVDWINSNDAEPELTSS